MGICTKHSLEGTHNNVSEFSKAYALYLVQSTVLSAGLWRRNSRAIREMSKHIAECAMMHGVHGILNGFMGQISVTGQVLKST